MSHITIKYLIWVWKMPHICVFHTWTQMFYPLKKKYIYIWYLHKVWEFRSSQLSLNFTKSYLQGCKHADPCGPHISWDLPLLPRQCFTRLSCWKKQLWQARPSCCSLTCKQHPWVASNFRRWVMCCMFYIYKTRE